MLISNTRFANYSCRRFSGFNCFLNLQFTKKLLCHKSKSVCFQPGAWEIVKVLSVLVIPVASILWYYNKEYQIIQIILPFYLTENNKKKQSIILQQSWQFYLQFCHDIDCKCGTPLHYSSKINQTQGNQTNNWN